jgi:hypothetical protein
MHAVGPDDGCQDAVTDATAKATAIFSVQILDQQRTNPQVNALDPHPRRDV